MIQTNKTKLLFKILVGAAWVDGQIQVEERNYLHKMARKYELSEDPEIKLLLSEVKSVKSQQCYEWLEEYLGSNPTEEEYQKLVESLSTIIYSDNQVATEEAKLLTYIQNSEPNTNHHNLGFDKFLKNIQKLYRQALENEI